MPEDLTPQPLPPNLKIIERIISDLNAAEYNPRELTKQDRQDLEASLNKFGLVDPIIVNTYPGRENIIVGGNQRVKLWSEFGHTTVPTLEVYVNEADERELNVRLNKNTGRWDWELLTSNFDISDLVAWGFDKGDLVDDEAYSRKIEAPIYEPTGDPDKPEDLYNDAKVKALEANIANADIPNEVKLLLVYAAQRHRVFDYGKIANYYCHAPAPVQRLMEQSALVIIDYDKAIEGGFVKLSKELIKMFTKDDQCLSPHLF